MNLIYNYIKEDISRHALNELTRKTFGFDFEEWVTNGYFEGDYIPYSFMEDGKILSNVSANKMCFMQNGVCRNYIQIGTVMTDETHRHQGLARKLIEYVIKEYEGKCDGIYLFGDLGALDFYRKIGFREGLQYQYQLKKECVGKTEKKIFFRPVDKQDEKLKLKYMDMVRTSAVNAALEQLNKFGLQMFYTADLSNVYYAEDTNCFAVMEMEEDTLMLQSVISREKVCMKNIISNIGMKYRNLKLGFTPCAEDAAMFEAAAYDGGDDYRLFYLGKELESIEKDKLFFPQLSHA